MTALPQDLFERQLAELDDLRQEAASLARVIADETWDCIEQELEQLTEDGVFWDLADHIQFSLQTQLGMMFDQRCEYWLGQRFERLASQLPAGVAAPDSGHGFYSLLKGLRLNQQLASSLEALFARSKPGIFSLIGRALIDDVEYACEHMEKDAHKDAARLRQNLYNARPDFTRQISQAATLLIYKSCHQYAEALKQLRRPSAA